MLKTCRRCGLLFMPERAGDEKCGRCAPKRVPFGGKPIDLYREWSDRDPC